MRNLKRALSLALASVMLVGLMVVGTGASYSDVTSKQNKEAIEVLQKVGIMVGDENGKFNPDQKVTRNEMAVVMANLMDYRVSSYKGTAPFTDVPAWAEPYVAACFTNGITSGMSATYYGGSETVTTAQAALMLMKALGYFQFKSDFADDWQLATVKQGNKIDLFDSVDSGVKDAMTRNDVAQLVLNTLQAGMVEANDDTINVTTPGVTVEAGKVTYNYITSNKSYATAISSREATSSISGTAGKIVELGEKLYNGDLKKDSTGDEFMRPGNVWTYNSNEVGKYADSADGSWTAKLTQKALYNAVGSSAYDGYTWTVYRNGDKIAYDTGAGNHDGRDAAIASSKTSTDRVLNSGDGVLTEVFVDSDAKTVVLSMIDTGVAKVTKVTGDAGNYEVTVSFKTKVKGASATEITPDTKFTTDQKFAKDDIVIYTASKSSGEIESMAVAQTAVGKVSAVKSADYVTINGTQYFYNYAYTDSAAAFIGLGLYNVEDSEPAQDPAVDKDATIYLDSYGNAVAFEGKTDSVEDYLIVTDKGSVFSSEPSAKVVFYDGTEATVTIDQLTTGASTVDATTGNISVDTVYKYTKSGSSYDLETVSQKTGTAATVKKDTPSITATGTANGVVTDNNTVFVDVENNKTWTGYKNVSSKADATVSVVMNKDNVADIVFIYGNFTGTADDNDYIVLKGLGYEAVKDSDNKTTYRLTDAYDITGTQLTNAYVTSSSVLGSISKGLVKVNTRNSSDYISDLDQLFVAANNGGDATSQYATTCKNGILALNAGIPFGGSNKTTFSYNDNTKVVVLDLKKGAADVDGIRIGSISDIETYDAAGGTANNDLTGVYVMTVDDETDVAPLAESILVIVPNTDSTSTVAATIDPQPTNTTVTFGSISESLTIAATASDGGTVTYQWKQNGANLGTTASQAIPTDLAVGTYNFTCVVTNTKDGKATSVTSSTAVVTVKPAQPVISGGSVAGDVSDKTITITNGSNLPAGTYTLYLKSAPTAALGTVTLSSAGTTLSFTNIAGLAAAATDFQISVTINGQTSINSADIR